MARPIQEYASDAIRVRFDPNRCIHAARCLMGDPEVFDVRRRRWVMPAAGDPGHIAAVIEECPSGALTYERLDGGPQEEPDAAPSVQVVANGPLAVRGRLTIADADGGEFDTGSRVALCRCGASENKPFCDNSHRAIRFVG